MSNWNKTSQSDAFKALSPPMTTTDPKLIEPVAFLLSYPCGGVRMRRLFFPEAPPCASSRIEGDKIEPLYTAAAINEAVQKERAGIWARMCSIEPDEELAGCPAGWGDFLQILEGELAATDERKLQHQGTNT